MQSVYESYRLSCQMISLLTYLEVRLFDQDKKLESYYAPHDLPAVIEQFKQETLAYILQQTLVKDNVYLFHDTIHLEFLVSGLWDNSAYCGTIVVGPFVSQVYHPQLLHEVSQRVPLPVQQKLQQSYNAITIIDEARQSVISYLIYNMFICTTKQPQHIEIILPHAEDIAARFKYAQEQDRTVIEKRYAFENKILHAINTGDSQTLKIIMEEQKGLPWPYRHPHAPLRSMKNLSLSHNTLFRKAAENAGVHPLYLDSISGKFAIQIEQAQSVAALASLYDKIPQTYCEMAREASLTTLSPLMKETVIYIRLNIDQPISLNDIADRLGLHPSYLSRTFKQEMGMTLTHYINKLRIEEAKYILAHEDASVTETALRVGYNDANYFSKVFTRLEHVTPHDYKKYSRR